MRGFFFWLEMDQREMPKWIEKAGWTTVGILACGLACLVFYGEVLK
jgi:hypothetical protein